MASEERSAARGSLDHGELTQSSEVTEQAEQAEPATEREPATPTLAPHPAGTVRPRTCRPAYI
jgi:hypothetical protein